MVRHWDRDDREFHWYMRDRRITGSEYVPRVSSFWTTTSETGDFVNCVMCVSVEQTPTPPPPPHTHTHTQYKRPQYFLPCGPALPIGRAFIVVTQSLYVVTFGSVTGGGGGNWTVTEFHQKDFQAILENFGSVTRTELWRGGGDSTVPKMKVAQF